MSHLQPALYDPTLVFFEENDIHRGKLAMDFKMYEIAKEAGEQKITLKVMTNDETFIGTVSSIDGPFGKKAGAQSDDAWG